MTYAENTLTVSRRKLLRARKSWNAQRRYARHYAARHGLGRSMIALRHWQQISADERAAYALWM
jgi:hypothetical protein